tara:strand:+ start:2045 stop:2233 length:189 start_codon:yes stop_codon:yes gene_type:complete
LKGAIVDFETDGFLPVLRKMSNPSARQNRSIGPNVGCFERKRVYTGELQEEEALEIREANAR